MTLLIIRELLKKPNIAFEKISQNPQYFRLSVILFSVSCFIAFFNEISTLIFLISYDLGTGPHTAFQAINLGGVILNHFLIIIFIFYIGKKFGGSANFKQVFSVLSFCLIPIIIGLAILSSNTMLFSYLFITDDELSLSYTSTFMLSPLMLSNFIMIPFFIWSIVLYVKAIKITDNFSTLKASILLISALLITGWASMLYDSSTSIPLQLMFH